MPFEPVEPGQFQPTEERQAPPRRYLTAIDGFVWVDLGANQAVTAMARSGLAVAAVPMPYPGHIVAVTIGSSAARTGGTATGHVYKNSATTGLTTSLDATNVSQNYATSTSLGFNAGDFLQARLSSSSWGPITADIEVIIWITLDIP